MPASLFQQLLTGAVPAEPSVLGVPGGQGVPLARLAQLSAASPSSSEGTLEDWQGVPDVPSTAGLAPAGTPGTHSASQSVIGETVEFRRNHTWNTENTKKDGDREYGSAPDQENSTPGEIWSDREEERAAIVEHSGKIPRDWVAGFARLHPDRPSGDVPLGRWQQFIDDLASFMDSGWAEKTAALGWGPLDLFGCDQTALRQDRLQRHPMAAERR
jgi:hypothetical protein